MYLLVALVLGADISVYCVVNLSPIGQFVLVTMCTDCKTRRRIESDWQKNIELNQLSTQKKTKKNKMPNRELTKQ